MPFLCVLAASAVVSGVSLLRRFSIPRTPRTLLIVALTVAALLPPSIASIRYLRILGTSPTSERAYAWMQANVPAGARIIVEGYGVVPPRSRFRVDHVRNALGLDRQALRQEGPVYLVLSAAALDAPQEDPAAYRRYRELIDSETELARFAPRGQATGPTLVILTLR